LPSSFASQLSGYVRHKNPTFVGFVDDAVAVVEVVVAAAVAADVVDAAVVLLKLLLRCSCCNLSVC